VGRLGPGPRASLIIGISGRAVAELLTIRLAIKQKSAPLFLLFLFACFFVNFSAFLLSFIGLTFFVFA
jgi:hypothetical protein